MTPSVTAAQPTLYAINGKTIRPLGEESDRAFALLAPLVETQQKRAILNYGVADPVMGQGQNGKKIQPEGSVDGHRSVEAAPTAPGRNGAAYYRIQGPTLVVEYALQQMGAGPTMHVHTIYRTARTTMGGSSRRNERCGRR